MKVRIQVVNPNGVVAFESPPLARHLAEKIKVGLVASKQPTQTVRVVDEHGNVVQLENVAKW